MTLDKQNQVQPIFNVHKIFDLFHCDGSESRTDEVNVTSASNQLYCIVVVDIFALITVMLIINYQIAGLTELNNGCCDCGKAIEAGVMNLSLAYNI